MSAAPPPAQAGVIWLLRHGKAADPLGFPDAARPLTERGEAQASAAGEALRGFAPQLDAILTSPRVRAHRTAQLACRAHGSAPEPVVIDEFGADYGPGTLLALTAPFFGEHGHVVVVGHNPTLSMLVEQLTGEARGLSTGTLVGIDLAARSVTGYARPPK